MDVELEHTHAYLYKLGGTYMCDQNRMVDFFFFNIIEIRWDALNSNGESYSDT